jgi:hypothetical protein
MKALAYRYVSLLVLGLAAILFSAADIAAITSWLPLAATAGIFVPSYKFPAASAKVAAVQATPKQREGKGRPKGRCAECGLIVSMLAIEGNNGNLGHAAAGEMTMRRKMETPVQLSGNYKITLRMADGSSRVITHASPASWRPGERVILIDGANPANGRAAR